jgi:hypothetical protein
MAIRKTLSAFGNSLGLVIERPVLEILGIDRATLLDISINGGSLVITPVASHEQPISDGTGVSPSTLPRPPNTAGRSPPGSLEADGVIRGEPWMGNYAPARLVSVRHRIRLMVGENPKHPGTACYARFSKYRDGMRVSDAYDAGVKPEDIRWDLAHRFIELHP